MRRSISSGETSSTCVAMCHWLPNWIAHAVALRIRRRIDPPARELRWLRRRAPGRVVRRIRIRQIEMDHRMRFFSRLGLREHDSGIANRHFGVHDSTAGSVHLEKELSIEGLFQKIDQFGGIGFGVHRVGRYGCISFWGIGIRHKDRLLSRHCISAALSAPWCSTESSVSSFSVCQRAPLAAAPAIASFTVNR